jgi:hypothetical protein
MPISGIYNGVMFFRIAHIPGMLRCSKSRNFLAQLPTVLSWGLGALEPVGFP